MSAKVYSDVKGSCSCGGSFNARMIILKVDMPVCDKCGETPSLLRIRARIKNENGEVKPVDIRHDKLKNRLTEASDCISVFRQVSLEIQKGEFNYKDYDSKKARDSQKLKNYLHEVYLKHHEIKLKNGDLTPAGMYGKRAHVKNLTKYFGEFDINEIKGIALKRFCNTFDGPESVKHACLKELRTILRFAEGNGDINRCPPFPKLSQGQLRDRVMTAGEARKIIPQIENDFYRFMIAVMFEYALRPCEVRAIQFRDIDLENNLLHIRRHFSLTKLLDGRKCIKEGRNSNMSFPLAVALKDYAKAQNIPFSSSEFVFRGATGNHVHAQMMSNIWNHTLKRINYRHIQLYELRHAKATEITEEGGAEHARDFLGHNSITTTDMHYARPKFNKELYVNVIGLVR